MKALRLISRTAAAERATLEQQTDDRPSGRRAPKTLRLEMHLNHSDSWNVDDSDFARLGQRGRRQVPPGMRHRRGWNAALINLARRIRCGAPQCGSRFIVDLVVKGHADMVARAARNRRSSGGYRGAADTLLRTKPLRGVSPSPSYAAPAYVSIGVPEDGLDHGPSIPTDLGTCTFPQRPHDRLDFGDRGRSRVRMGRNAAPCATGTGTRFADPRPGTRAGRQGAAGARAARADHRRSARTAKDPEATRLPNWPG